MSGGYISQILVGDVLFSSMFEFYSYMTQSHIFVGVTTKNNSETSKRNSRGWCGWGVVNNLACESPDGQQRSYGEMMIAGPTIGVLLDMNRGTLSFLRFGDSACQFHFLHHLG